MDFESGFITDEPDTFDYPDEFIICFFIALSADNNAEAFRTMLLCEFRSLQELIIAFQGINRCACIVTG